MSRFWITSLMLLRLVSSAAVCTKSVSSSSPTITTMPDSCTFRPTQTWYSTTGCEIPCDPSVFCVYDAAVTLPCGCPSVKVESTAVTVCPTQTSCVQCTTGWGLVTVTETCSSTATASATG